MKRLIPLHRFVLCAAVLVLYFAPLTAGLQAQEAATKEAAVAHVPGDATTPPLRQPGFMFTEFGTPKVEEYVAYFEKVAGYKVVYRKPSYVEMETSCAQVTFLDPAIWPKGHPFYNPPPDGKRGHSMEIGLVVADLDKAFAAASEFKNKGWPISSGIVMRPWGVRDFRVLAPDGYYFRFTEGAAKGK